MTAQPKAVLSKEELEALARSGFTAGPWFVAHPALSSEPDFVTSNSRSFVCRAFDNSVDAEIVSQTPTLLSTALAKTNEVEALKARVKTLTTAIQFYLAAKDAREAGDDDAQEMADEAITAARQALGADNE